MPIGEYDMRAMNQEMIDCAVERLRALADATRIRILMRLREGECSVNELSACLGVAQPSVSKHLALLRQAGLVRLRPEGAHSLYSIRDDTVFGICDIVCSAVRRQHNERAEALGIQPIGRRSKKQR